MLGDKFGVHVEQRTAILDAMIGVQADKVMGCFLEKHGDGAVFGRRIEHYVAASAAVFRRASDMRSQASRPQSPHC